MAHSRQGSSDADEADDVYSMILEAEPTSFRRGGRGITLLLAHCERIDRLTAPRAPSARARLEAELGGELTRSLLGSLCGSGPGRD